MKRTALVLALVLMLPCLLAASLLLPPQYGETWLAALPQKAALLADDAGGKPRIVLIGGSGVAFGFDSGLLEAELPAYRVVNDGLYAGLGTTIMLELALPDLRPGDIAIFSPELSEQTFSDWFDAEGLWQAAETSPGLLARADRSRRGALLAAFPSFAAQRARFWLRGEKPAGSGIYARASFTARGDVEASLRPDNIMPGGWDVNQPLRFDPALIDETFAARVNAFAAACRDRGVTVYFRFCPMNRAALAAAEESRIDAFTERLEAALDCPLLGSVERALMDAGWFYDTNFHLNGAGAAVQTARLAEELKAALGDPAPVAIRLPEMPDLALPQTAAGDDGDAACFRCEERAGALAVVGLTDEGKRRERLTVPAQWAGEPVAVLVAEAFAGADRLREVTLQPGLRVIEDGAFAHCPSLERINLLLTEPSACTVGEGLLSGTNAAVYVPAASYGRFVTNYFWARHASRLRRDGQAETAQTTAPAPAQTGQAAARRATRLTYDANGGILLGQPGTRLTREISYARLRENTLPGSMWMAREGYVLAGWNTEPDGSGLSVGLGSRVDPARAQVLYAQWLPCAPEEAFDWEAEPDGACVTGWHGSASTLVLPQTLGGLPVRGIRAGAFAGAAWDELVFPPSLRRVEPGAFADCAVGTLRLSDSLTEISDDSFRGGEGPATLRLSAATAPVYAGSYFAALQDKLDWLRSLAGQRKLLLASGSSGRYGYDSELLHEAFPELMPVNLGVYAYTNARPIYDLILPWTEAGDVLLCAPEFDAVAEQFCVSDRLDTGFWAMMEADYDTAAALDMRAYTGVLDSLGAYLSLRRGMPAGSYEMSPAAFDDDGVRYPFATYNRYGDYILPRPNGETDGLQRHNIADYTAESIPAETIRALDGVLDGFVRRGVRVLFSYTPRNSASLTARSTPEARRALDALLRETLRVPVISDIEDSLMLGRYFYQIDSHLSTEGAKLHTRQVIRDLRAALTEAD